MYISTMFFSKTPLQSKTVVQKSYYFLIGNTLNTVIVVIIGINRGDLDCSWCLTMSFLKKVCFSPLPTKTKQKMPKLCPYI